MATDLIVCLAFILLTVARSRASQFSLEGGRGFPSHGNGSILHCDDVTVDLVFVLDSSASVTPHNFELTKEFVKDFLLPADIDGGSVRVGLIVYSDTSRIVLRLHGDQTKTEVLGAVDGIPYTPGSTNTASALRTMRQDVFFSKSSGNRAGVDKVAIVVTDGTSNSRAQTLEQARMVKQAGIHVYAVGIGLRNTVELDRIASDPPEDNRISVPDYPSLMTLDKKVFKIPCSCRTKADVFFIVGMSTTLGQQGFDTVKSFVVNAVRDLQVNSAQHRVNFLTYSGLRLWTAFSTKHASKDRFNELVMETRYQPGDTNMEEALGHTNLLISTDNEMPKAIVLITDIYTDASESNLKLLAKTVKARASGTTIVSISKTPSTSGKGINPWIVSPPRDANSIELTDWDTLPAMAGPLVYSFCDAVDYCARTPCHNEGICLPAIRSYRCVCHSGFYGTNCEKACGPPSDLILLLDASKDTTSGQFKSIQSYANILVQSLGVFICDVNIGVVKYTSSAALARRLGPLHSLEEIHSAIDRMRNRGSGTPDIANALRFVRTKLFNGYGGDRAGTRNVVVILTRGTGQASYDKLLSEAELLVDSGTIVIPVRVRVESSTWPDVMATVDAVSHASSTASSIEPLLSLGKKGASKKRHVGAPRVPIRPGHGQGQGHGQEQAPDATDLILAVDATSFYARKQAKRLMRSVVRRMNEQTRVALVTFGKSPKVSLSLDSGKTKRDVRKAIKGLKRMKGKANPTRAVNLILSLLRKAPSGDGDRVETVVVMVTSVMRNDTRMAINRLKLMGTRLQAVGVWMDPYQVATLTACVSFPSNQNLLIVDNKSRKNGFDRNKVDFLNFLPQETTHCLSFPCRNGGQCVNTEKTYECVCPSGFSARNCQLACDSHVDVGVVINADRRNSLEDFRSIKKFLRRLIDNLDIGGRGKSRLGVVTVNSNSRAVFLLNNNMTKREVKSAIRGMPYQYGVGNLTDGIQFARKHLFSKQNGDRSYARNFLIILTRMEKSQEESNEVLHHFQGFDHFAQVHQSDVASLDQTELAREQDITVAAIGIGGPGTYGRRKMFETDLKEPNRGGGIAVTVDAWKRLPSIASLVMEKICFSGDMCSASPCHNDGMCVPMPQRGSYQCVCPRGFMGDNCDHDCNRKRDVAIILDVSGHVVLDDVIRSTNFTSNLVRELTGSGSNFRFALMTYKNAHLNTVFGFDSSQTPKTVMAAIGSLTDSSRDATSSDLEPFDSSDDVSVEFRQSVSDLFQSASGNGSVVEEVAILLTHEKSRLSLRDAILDLSTAKKNGVHGKVKVIAVDVNSKVDDEVYGDLDLLSFLTHVMTVQSFQELNSIKQDVANLVCT